MRLLEKGTTIFKKYLIKCKGDLHYFILPERRREGRLMSAHIMPISFVIRWLGEDESRTSCEVTIDQEREFQSGLQ